MNFIKLIGYIFAITFLLGCTGGNNLNGTWMSDNDFTLYDFGAVQKENCKIIFKGNSFTIMGEAWDPVGVGLRYFPNLGNSCTIYTRTRRPDGNWVYNTETKGKYSITNNSIELITSDGTIKVFPFSRTENTFKIDYNQFTRKR